MSTFYKHPYHTYDELYHYGVLGMKWGMHRAARKGRTYEYKSWGTKRNERKAAKMDRKIDKAFAKEMKAWDRGKSGDRYGKQVMKYADKESIYKRRAERSHQIDKYEQNRAKRTSAAGVVTGRALATMATGNVGFMFGTTSKAFTQHQAISNLNGKDERRMITAGANFAKAYVFGVPGRVISKSLYMRKGERQFMKDRKAERDAAVAKSIAESKERNRKAKAKLAKKKNPRVLKVEM